jgi:hypothetical protein
MGLLTQLLIVVALIGCGGTRGSEPTILATMEGSPEGEQSALSERFAPKGPVSLQYRVPEKGGNAYRLTLEIMGEQASRTATSDEDPEPLRESRAIEVAYRELPLENSETQDYTSVLRLDELHYIQKQRNPDAQREVELADDRLRLFINGKKTTDIGGARAEGVLTPRSMLDRVFGVIVHDSTGNPVNVSRKGVPAVRRYLTSLPMLTGILYAMIPLPEDPIGPGSKWTAVRLPPSRAGELGLQLNIEYSVAGFDVVDGVPCALITLLADEQGVDVPSAAGFSFDRVQATLTGTAWIEIESARPRRVVLEDEMRATWTGRDEQSTTRNYRLRYESQLELTLREPDEKLKLWADGSKRFGDR